ncbi:MAG: type VI secretion system protein ImpE [Oleiphilaceae bacterium]|jgi:type VI secretion system protein ImpE
MSPEEYIKNGNPAEAKKALMGMVREDPANVDHRVFLFQLCCVLGDYDRALNQLNVIGEMSPKALAMVQTYREVLQCEGLRQSVFRGEKTPLFFGEPEPWVGDIFESLKLQALGKSVEASQLRAAAYDQISTVSGTINEEPFQWIADADSRIGPMLEVIMNGKYYWVPFEHIAKIEIEAPEDLRDYVWLAANFTWKNEGQVVGFIPSRYPGSESAEDGLIQLARKTEWVPILDDAYSGLGQKMMATDENDYALFDIREIVFDATETSEP